QIHLDKRDMRRSADVSYAGQGYTLNLAVPGGPLSGESMEAIATAFRENHQRLYGFASDTDQIVIRNLRVKGNGRLPKVGRKAAPESLSTDRVSEVARRSIR